jgi:hypothetical protein
MVLVLVIIQQKIFTIMLTDALTMLVDADDRIKALENYFGENKNTLQG